MEGADIYFIRHAESMLNIASHQFREKHNLPYIWELLCTYEGFLKGVKYNPDFVDCSITEKGVNQCIKARNKIVSSLNPDVILVSPLQRTLQTCNHIFENRNIPVFVEAVLSQAFRSSCDLSRQLSKKVQKYPNYNFENVLCHGDLWFLKNESEENQQKYYKLLESAIDKSHDQKNKMILDYMTETMIYEIPQNVRQRSWKVKQLLKKYKEKYNKIAVVAHYNTINYTVAKEFEESHEPKDSANVHNCEVRFENLEELLKYK